MEPLWAAPPKALGFMKRLMQLLTVARLSGSTGALWLQEHGRGAD